MCGFAYYCLGRSNKSLPEKILLSLIGMSFSRPGVERYSSLAIYCISWSGASPWLDEAYSSSFFNINYKWVEPTSKSKGKSRRRSKGHKHHNQRLKILNLRSHTFQRRMRWTKPSVPPRAVHTGVPGQRPTYLASRSATWMTLLSSKRDDHQIIHHWAGLAKWSTAVADNAAAACHTWAAGED